MEASQEPSGSVLETLLASRSRFLAFLARRVGSLETAEDILQTAFVKAVERGALIRDDERVEAWFYRLLRNAVVDHYRRRATEARKLEGLAQELETEVDTSLEQAVCECVKDVLITLKPSYAEIVQRVDLAEGHLAEVAHQAGITINNATNRLRRARVALRRRLIEACGACTEHGCLSCACRKKPAPAYDA